MAHRIKHRGPYPVDLGERASSGGRLLETLLAQDDGGLCGECLQDLTILRGKWVPEPSSRHRVVRRRVS